jgi:hypothetical protein
VLKYSYKESCIIFEGRNRAMNEVGSFRIHNSISVERNLILQLGEDKVAVVILDVPCCVLIEQKLVGCESWRGEYSQSR